MLHEEGLKAVWAQEKGRGYVFECVCICVGGCWREEGDDISAILSSVTLLTFPLCDVLCSCIPCTVAQAVYDRLFTWLVHRINDSLASDFHGRQTVMGLLDIYGFEIMAVNR